MRVCFGPFRVFPVTVVDEEVEERCLNTPTLVWRAYQRSAVVHLTFLN